jgi:hypothetical protein
MGGRLRPESVAGINRNGWPASSGIAGRNRPEYAAILQISKEYNKVFQKMVQYESDTAILL